MTAATSCNFYICIYIYTCVCVCRHVPACLVWGWCVEVCARTEGSQPPVCFMELVQMQFLNVCHHAFLLVVFHSILVTHAFVRHAHLETVVFVPCSTCHGHSCHRPAKWRNRWWCLLLHPALACPSPWTRYCYLQFVWGWCQLFLCVIDFCLCVVVFCLFSRCWYLVYRGQDLLMIFVVLFSC